MDNEHRCGTIALVGRPNVGKSTLLNAFIGQKISITSRKAQTTRHRITGILTRPHAQYIFIDTPGFQTQYTGALNQSLNRTVCSALSQIDLCLFVVEANHFGGADQKVLQLIQPGTVTALLINKIDLLPDSKKLLSFLQRMRAIYPFCEWIPLSAKRPSDIERCLDILLPYLPVGGLLYEEDALTDCSERFLATETLREKIFRFTGDELPYTSTVVIDKFEQKEHLRRIFCTILVDCDRHKGMIIGQRGEKLKRICTQARLDLEKCLNGPVYLEVWVKVKKGWADHAAQLRAYGYES